jgi:ABC-2 type transport system permease protein
VLNPAALETYEAEENTVVVSCAATNKTRTLQITGASGYNEALILLNPEAAYSGQYVPVAIDAEGQLTSAISYVTSEETHKLYYLEGHGESPLGSAASDAISKSNIETASLNLLKEGSIPSDCELIVSFNPANDLVSDELDMLETYLKTGGNVMLLLDNPDLPNYNTLLETYGLQMKDGYIGDYNNYYNKYFNNFGYFCIYPELSASDDVTASITEDAILIGSRGLLEITPLRRGATVSAFMTTSEQGFLDADENSEGQYILGATSVETFEDVDDTESRLTVIAAINLVSDQISTSFSNIDIFMNAVNRNFGEVNNVVIPPKSLEVGTVTVSHPVVWNVLFIGLIPLAFIGGGLAYWIRRRNR